VNWHKGDALHPETFARLFPEVGGVVHTLGIIIEDSTYKQALKEGNVPRLMGSFFRAMTGNHGNPLENAAEGARTVSYELINRDAALRVCDAFVSSTSSIEASNTPRPFVYISAEDVSRPIIPARYIETKREAEQRIEAIMVKNPEYRGVYIRPSLVYHAHQRPLTTPAAVLLDLSATLHSKLPSTFPTPSNVIRTLGSIFSRPGAPSSLGAIADALTIPPIHVDHVAEAICATLDSSANPIRGVVGVRQMRELVGWSDGSRQAHRS